MVRQGKDSFLFYPAYRKKRKGQIIGQVFIYAFASIIFILVLIYGYRAISKFIEQKDYVAMIEMRTKIKSVVNSIASSTSIEKVSINMPTYAEKVCFVDLRKSYSEKASSGLCRGGSERIPLICNTWKDNVSKNVFLVPPISLNINIGDITLYDNNNNDVGYLCLDVINGKIYMQIEGEGDSTGIRKWVPAGQ